MRFNIIDGALDCTERKKDGICLLRMFLEKSLIKRCRFEHWNSISFIMPLFYFYRNLTVYIYSFWKAGAAGNTCAQMLGRLIFTFFVGNKFLLLSSSGPGQGQVRVRWGSGRSDFDLSSTLFLVFTTHPPPPTQTFFFASKGSRQVSWT